MVAKGNAFQRVEKQTHEADISVKALILILLYKHVSFEL